MTTTSTAALSGDANAPALDPASDEAVDRAIERAIAHLERLQTPEGSLRGDYGGPMFLLPMYVATAYVVGMPLDATTRDGMIRHLRHAQNADGGFGLHVEGSSLVFTSTLAYVALRLLGVAADDPSARAALAFVHRNGGPLAAAAWGKFVLAVLGLYDYAGLDPVQPELWLLPEKLPMHPSRLWCHCRMVYLPMSWLYGMRARAAETDLLGHLRRELYPAGFGGVDWPAHRADVAACDALVPRSPVIRAIHRAMAAYEARPPSMLRKKALAFVLDQIRQEDENTQFICIGPVSKLFHCLVWHFERPNGEELRAHLASLPQYLFEAADGIKMNGYNSSELWDTAFAVQALAATGRASAHLSMLRAAFHFIDGAQVREDVPHRARYFRDPSKGGFPFSTRAHGWPISDCTAEGILACLDLEPFVDAPLSEARLTDAVDLVLALQNDDGGWATYEKTRGPRWLEQLNPSDCFADIMIDYSYVECTSACLQALARFRDRYPGVRGAAIDEAIARGARSLLDAQRADGSWEGSWGVCFTYGTWFGVTGLLAAGLPEGHPALEAACRFLLSRQAPDGSWGETAESCRLRRYVPAERGQAVMTAWAVLALVAAGRRGAPEVRRALGFLVARQEADGHYPEEHIAGMFNKTCAIHYDHYLDVFPLWALAEGRGRVTPRAGGAP